MRKPFPPPPGATAADPFGPPNRKDEEYDPRLTDDEYIYIMGNHLTKSQMADEQLKRFILHYVTYRSSPDAAEHAGYPRYKGSYLRSRPEVHACIEALTNKAVMKYGYDATEVIERAKEIASIDPLEFQNPDGSFKTHMSQIKPEARRAIKKFVAKNLYGEDANGMKIVIGQLVTIELWDKLKGIELLGREKNIFKQTTVHEHDITSNMSNFLLDSQKRGEERKQLMARDVEAIDVEETKE